MAKRVAVLGASGIGRHHAAWWHLEGAEVCAFSGTSEASVARARAVLEAYFGFAGNAYTDVAALLAAEQPDIVDVCTPHAVHGAHAWAALEAGCDVLCEKPMIYDPALTPEAMLEEAESLFALARERGRILSVCTQYSVAARLFEELFESQRGGEPVTVLAGRLESPAKERDPDPVRIWVDLSPHLISVLLALFPGAKIQWPTLQTRFDGYEADAAFDVRTADGGVAGCRFHTGNRVEPPNNIRQFSLNGYDFDVQGRPGADGVFGAHIVHPDGATDAPDMMRLLIRDFLAGKSAVSEENALQNLQIMLEILRRAG